MLPQVVRGQFGAQQPPSHAALLRLRGWLVLVWASQRCWAGLHVLSIAVGAQLVTCRRACGLDSRFSPKTSAFVVK